MEGGASACRSLRKCHDSLLVEVGESGVVAMVDSSPLVQFSGKRTAAELQSRLAVNFG